MALLLYIIVTLVALMIFYLKRQQTYWTRKGVQQINPQFLFGNFKDFAVRKQSFGDLFLKLYKELKKRDVKHGGVYVFTRPTYVPLDLDIIKAIMVKDFDIFMNHGTYFNEKQDPLTMHLFNLEGSKWKSLRAKLSPTFTSGKMKMMYQTFVKCATELNDMLSEYCEKLEPVEIKEVLARFTTDIIGSCAFGLECNCMKQPNSEFRKYGKRIFHRTHKENLYQILSIVVPKSVLSILGIKITPPEVENFFIKIVRETVEYRETNKVARPDFLQLLLQLRQQGYVSNDDNIEIQKETDQTHLSMPDLAAQCFVFFAAGYETSSTTMTFALYELAQNQQIQEKLREEIGEVLRKHKNKMTYEAVMDMHYLDRVIQEALRKYPPVPGTIRKCLQDYKVPGTHTIIDKGTNVHIPIFGIHMDPDYYPNPTNFDPDRFTEENKSARPAFTWLPFGEGPRICIGLRFGLLQSKVGIATVIKNFKLSVNEKTVTPLVMDPDSFISSAKGSVWLNMTKV
ncbi:cytochrome P450 6a2-like isoform X2 [Cylas formicarius]|nr:cytochrome P450 6a2-like isoform X2 [Cylas formicarius]XP_060523681.1 cytochrome P450 6a2-like isoform X2 [Cylas formicarius]